MLMAVVSFRLYAAFLGTAERDLHCRISQPDLGPWN